MRKLNKTVRLRSVYGCGDTERQARRDIGRVTGVSGAGQFEAKVEFRLFAVGESAPRLPVIGDRQAGR
jgi:hypothetical protein